jgi:hypothetical protein
VASPRPSHTFYKPCRVLSTLPTQGVAKGAKGAASKGAYEVVGAAEVAKEETQGALGALKHHTVRGRGGRMGNWRLIADNSGLQAPFRAFVCP